MRGVTLCCVFLLVPCVVFTKGFTTERLVPRLDEEARTNIRRGRVAVDDYGATPAKDEITQVFVRYHDEMAKSDVLAAAEAVVEDPDDDNVVLVKMRQTAYEQIKFNEKVEAEIDNKVEAFVVAHEARTLDVHQRLVSEEVPWGIKMIQADQLEVGSHDVTLCIIDTGYAQGHPDLPTTTTGTSTPERNFTWNEDLNGHGTHVAGIVAAIGGNNIGVRGAGSIKLHIARGLDQYSAGYESDVRRAVTQCVDAGAKVISISLGSSVMSTTANDLYSKTVEEDGVIMVAAAGNQGGEGNSYDAYPASHPSVISVAAVYEWGTYWEGSNFCDQVELAAPGYRVLSTSVSTSVVRTSDFSYPAQKVSGAPSNEIGGILINCGPGNYQCSEASGAICLMVRDETDLETMIENCENGGGIGAVIFDAADESSQVMYQDWNANSNIPAVGVEHVDGINLLAKQDTEVYLGFSYAEDDREYSYRYLSGTSMATPHVAAAAALVWSHFPQCSNHQIRQALAVTAEDKGASGCDWHYGYGIVKAKDAYDFLLANDCTQGDWWQPTGDNTPVCEWNFPNVAFYGQSAVAGSGVDSSEVVLVPSEAPTASPTKALKSTAAQQALPTSSTGRSQNLYISTCSIAFIYAIGWIL